MTVQMLRLMVSNEDLSVIWRQPLALPGHLTILA